MDTTNSPNAIAILHRYRRLRAVTHRAVELEQRISSPRPHPLRNADRRAALSIVTDYVDELRPKRHDDDATVSIFLRLARIHRGNAAKVAKAVPRGSSRFIPQCDSYLLHDPTWSSHDPHGLTTPFRNHVYLVPKATEVELIDPLRFACPQGIAMSTELPDEIPNTHDRAEAWGGQLVGHFAGEFLDQLNQLPEPRGMFLVPVWAASGWQMLGVVITVRRRPFVESTYLPEFRIPTLYGLADLGWTISKFI